MKLIFPSLRPGHILMALFACFLMAEAPMRASADDAKPVKSKKEATKKKKKKKKKKAADTSEAEPAEMVQRISQLKPISGKPDMKADFYVFIIMTGLYIFNCGHDPDGVLRELNNGATVRTLEKIQKKKGVETIVLVEEGADLKVLKQKALKLHKLRCPVMYNSLEAMGTLAYDADEIMLVSRDGQLLEFGYMPIVADSILQEIETRQRAAAE